MAYERVLIIGNCGAGKSHLAQRLAAETGLPLVHLDREYYGPGWQKPLLEVWAKRITELSQRPQWIMDGNYLNTLELRLVHAQLVVWVDTLRWACMGRVIRRILCAKTRDDMPPDCRERWDGAFLRYVWRYDKDMRPRVAAVLANTQTKIVVLRGKRQIEAWLNDMKGLTSIN